MSQVHLHKIVNDTRFQRWCGPSAVCTITGWPMSAVREQMRVGHRRLMGSDIHQLRRALEAAGWSLRWSVRNQPERRGRTTLAAWMRAREDRSETNVVMLTGHWVVVRGNKFCDSATGEPVNLREAPGRRARVQGVYRAERVRRVRRPEPVVVRRRATPRARPAPYRVGHVGAEGEFVPTSEWGDRHDADRAGRDAARACPDQREDFQGQLTEPVVVQRRRDMRFTRMAAFWGVADGFDRVDDIQWHDDPAVAALEECR